MMTIDELKSNIRREVKEEKDLSTMKNLQNYLIFRQDLLMTHEKDEVIGSDKNESKWHEIQGRIMELEYIIKFIGKSDE